MKTNKIELSIKIKRTPFTENISGHNKYILKAFLNYILLKHVI